MRDLSGHYALVVATGSYQDSRLPALTGPAADARRLTEVLGSPSVGNFEVKLVSDASVIDIRRAVRKFLSERRAGDLALLHFSCHGVTEGGRLYLAAADTDPQALLDTAVSAADLNELMQRSPADRVVLLLDCCYSGAFGTSIGTRDLATPDLESQFTPTHLAPGQGVVVIAASTATQYAREGRSRSAPSIFTAALTDGLATGDADLRGDGEIALSDLYKYVHDKLAQAGADQTPMNWAFGIKGDPIIARSPHRRIKPGALPADLQARVQDSEWTVRLAAVHELKRRAGSLDLGMALAARQALVAMQDDDSKQVGNAVAEALSKTALGVSADAVDLG